jgi:hypothetical protein
MNQLVIGLAKGNLLYLKDDLRQLLEAKKTTEKNLSVYNEKITQAKSDIAELTEFLKVNE